MRLKGGFARFWIIQLHFLDDLDTFQIVWKLSRSNRHSFRSSKFSLDYPDTFLNYPDTFRIVRKLSRSPRHISRSSGLFLDYLDTFSRLSGHCLERRETFQIIHTLFRLSGHIFQINRTLLGSSGNYQDYLDTLLDHPEVFFRLSGNFPVHPDTLHFIWIFCIAKYPEILQPIMNLSQKLCWICKNFPVSIADALTGFL